MDVKTLCGFYSNMLKGVIAVGIGVIIMIIMVIIIIIIIKFIEGLFCKVINFIFVY